MTLLMTAGEFDLSVGSVFGFSAGADVDAVQHRRPAAGAGFLVALLARRLIGLVNGWFVTRLKIPSFLVTLGMLLVVRGTALFITDGFPQRTWSAAGEPLAADPGRRLLRRPLAGLHVAVLVRRWPPWSWATS